jgi:hypothetical protein
VLAHALLLDISHPLVLRAIKLQPKCYIVAVFTSVVELSDAATCIIELDVTASFRIMH